MRECEPDSNISFASTEAESLLDEIEPFFCDECEDTGSIISFGRKVECPNCSNPAWD